MSDSKAVSSRIKCAHKPCRCSVAAPQKHCSTFCSDADKAGSANPACKCGHEGCCREHH